MELKMRPALYVMCGISGSGKSYCAEHIKATIPNTVVVSTDAIREDLFGSASIQKDGDKVFKIAYDCTRVLLEEGKNVVFDAMSLRPRDRYTLISQFDTMAHMICVVTGNDCARAIRNQAKRDRRVPDEVVLAQSKRFKMPTIEEGWETIWTINA